MNEQQIFTDENGNNWADELDYRLWNPIVGAYQYISLDAAIGKVITSTEVLPQGGITIYVRDADKP